MSIFSALRYFKVRLCFLAMPAHTNCDNSGQLSACKFCVSTVPFWLIWPGVWPVTRWTKFWLCPMLVWPWTPSKIWPAMGEASGEWSGNVGEKSLVFKGMVGSVPDAYESDHSLGNGCTVVFRPTVQPMWCVMASNRWKGCSKSGWQCDIEQKCSGSNKCSLSSWHNIWYQPSYLL